MKISLNLSTGIRMDMKARAIGALVLTCLGVPVSAAITDTSGKLSVSGSSSFTYATTTTPRLIWDGSRRHFQAGVNLSSSSNATNYSFIFGDNISPYYGGDYMLLFGNGDQGGGFWVNGNYLWAVGKSGSDEFNVWGDHAFGFGYDIYAQGDFTFAFGDDPSASGQGAISMGRYTSAGTSGVAMGYSTWAGGPYAVAMGYNSNAHGTGSVAMGYMNEADGYGAMAMGKLSVIDLSPSADQSRPAFAFGEGLTVKDDYAFVIGRNNSRSSVATNNYLFVIGNGTSSSSPSDAFSVDENGNVWAAGTITAAGNSSFSGDLNFNGNALISSKSGSTNIDHIWYSDGAAGGAGGTWNFVSDKTYKAGGNARLQAAHIWMTGSGNNNYIAGNLGIGTTAPSAKLDVVGSVRVRGTLKLDEAQGDIPMGQFTAQN